MDGNKEVGIVAWFEEEVPKKENVDIIKILEQCNIDLERWKDYIRAEPNRL